MQIVTTLFGLSVLNPAKLLRPYIQDWYDFYEQNTAPIFVDLIATNNSINRTTVSLGNLFSTNLQLFQYDTSVQNAKVKASQANEEQFSLMAS